MIRKSNYRKNRKSNKLTGGSIKKWDNRNLIVPVSNVHQHQPDISLDSLQREIDLKTGQFTNIIPDGDYIFIIKTDWSKIRLLKKVDNWYSKHFEVLTPAKQANYKPTNIVEPGHSSFYITKELKIFT